MLYGRRLDQALEHVEDSRYALVHAVSKRARQITLWLTADPTELRAEAAPPPSASDIISRDPIALAENEIISGEVQVRWDPHGRADELDLPEGLLVPADPLLLDSLGDDDDFDLDGDADDSPVTPALAQVLDTDIDASDDDDDEEEEADDPAAIDDLVVDDAAEADEDSDIIEVSLEQVQEDEVEELHDDEEEL
jgi:hypothetical protein